MIRTRESLKMQAKGALKCNYWKLVLVSLIFLLISGGVSTATNASTTYDNVVNPNDQFYSYDYGYGYDEDSDFYYYESDEDGIRHMYEDGIDPYYNASLPERVFSNLGGIWALLFGFIGLIGILALSLALLLLDILVFNPLVVGIHRFFLVSQKFPAQLRELACSFDSNYWTTVKTMFFRDLKIILWSFLFIIPGIVKSYEYRMVPYLLAECPELSQQEVFAASADLMYGNKWRAFVLDLSFIGWDILSTITLGLVGIFYVNPYQNLTNAAFYQAVCQEKNGQQGQTF